LVRQAFFDPIIPLCNKFFVISVLAWSDPRRPRNMRELAAIYYESYNFMDVPKNFEIKIPNKLTAKTLKDSENGKQLHKVSDIHELFQELNS
jgi:hypothetical protein